MTEKLWDEELRQKIVNVVLMRTFPDGKKIIGKGIRSIVINDFFRIIEQDRQYQLNNEKGKSDKTDKEKLSLLKSFILYFIPKFLKKDKDINIKVLAKNFSPSIREILTEK